MYYIATGGPGNDSDDPADSSDSDNNRPNDSSEPPSSNSDSDSSDDDDDRSMGVIGDDFEPLNDTGLDTDSEIGSEFDNFESRSVSKC